MELVDRMELIYDSWGLILFKLDAKILPQEKLLVERTLEDTLHELIFDVQQLGNLHELFVLVFMCLQ